MHLSPHRDHSRVDARHGRHDPIGTQREEGQGFEKRRAGASEGETRDDHRAECRHRQKLVQPSRRYTEYHLVAVHRVESSGFAEVVGLHGSHGPKSDQFQESTNSVRDEGSGLRCEGADGGAVALQAALREPANEQRSRTNDARDAEEDHCGL